jgi:hypothetical protein
MVRRIAIVRPSGWRIARPLMAMTDLCHDFG